MGKFKNKVIIITGGAGGMGAASARKFLESNAIVYLLDINAKALKSTEERFSGLSGTVKSIVCDISKVDQIEHAIKGVMRNEDRIDVVVNSAGVWVEGPSETMTQQMWDNTIDINLKGTFFMCSRAIPALEKTQGCIVNISSDAGLVGNNEAAIYCASKGGVTLITKALAIELAPKGIRVNAICPGDVMSPMLERQAREYGADNPEKYFQELLANYPQKDKARFATVEEIAEAIYFLASPNNGAITGACLSIDFGVTAGY
jgi:NAD(P)-dependent dehydrogenase (short-subunit alcohol dehydrogenase family)